MAEEPMKEDEVVETDTIVPEHALPDHPVLAALFEQFPDAEWQLSSGQDTAVVPPGLAAFSSRTFWRRA